MTGPELWKVRADPGQIEQVLVNLIVNARDAMPSGGTVTIETSNVSLDNSSSRMESGVPPGNYVMLAVSDTGFGMDDNLKENIFEPFFTTKEKGKGTGLGLATCYGIVKQSGGHIWVYSEPGKGSTFKIYLPRITDRSILQQIEEISEPVSFGQATVLLAEDEEAVRQLVFTGLEQLGYEVLQAANGYDALKLSRDY